VPPAVRGFKALWNTAKANKSAMTAALRTVSSNTDAGDARARASGLLAELGQLLGDNDPRWLAFGFEMPGSPSTPEVPENVTATAGAAGTPALFIDWDDARRADGYRVIVTNAVGGAQLASVLTQDSEVSIGNLPAGANVNVTVTARNAAGESQPTAPITAVVP